MNILVTGGSGFLGFHIIELLINEGHKVVNFSRSHSKELDSLGVMTRLGNLEKIDEIKKALLNIDAVFHVASKVSMWGKWKDFYSINTKGTKNLIDCMKELNIKFLVYTSTPSVVFDKNSLNNVDETTPYPEKFYNSYSKSKKLAEEIVLNSNSNQLKTVALRPHLIYGERDKNLIPRLVKSARDKKLKVIGDGENTVDIIYVNNAAAAHIKAFNELLKENSKVEGKAYFLGQERPVKLYKFINQLLDIYNEGPIKKKISLRLAYFIGTLFEFTFKLFCITKIDPPMTRFIALNLSKSHYFSHQNAKNDFGFDPKISIEESLEILRTNKT